MTVSRFLICLLVFFSIAGCTGIKKPAPTPGEAPKRPLSLVSPEKIPFHIDDLDRDSLIAASEKSLQYYDGIKDTTTYLFGERKVTVNELKESLRAFRDIIRSQEPEIIKWRKILNAFDVYRATGYDSNGTVLFTGYFESSLEGSMKETEHYKYPVYRTPDDILVINLGKFNKKYNNEKIIGRLTDGEVIPYYTRFDIEEAGSLRGKNLELVWVNDPVDLFFMHIQGSGKIRLPDEKRIQVSFAQKNGRPVRMIGRYLLDKGKLSDTEITHQSIKKYLREHPEELSHILNHNESYIFFRIVENGPIGALGLTLTAGRSIATDLDLFPRGAIAIIKLRMPIVDERGSITAWKSFSRFVLNQDTGGLIKGPGRVDLFCGSGDHAEVVAGSLKEKGELYFLVKKKQHSN
jgi:membrane-bound lytic murein transglycosylase A